MSGYDGFSKSNNARKAESQGRYPLTVAVRELAKIAGCTQKEARAILDAVGRIEWHHSSKHYNEVDYYSIDAGRLQLEHGDWDSANAAETWNGIVENEMYDPETLEYDQWED